MPTGHPFTSYKRWGKFVGGVMKLAGLGDPTLPHEEEPLIAGDQRTAAMKAVYEVCYDRYGEQWKPKTDIYQLVTANQEHDDRLGWFGDLSGPKAKSGLMKLGKTISFFDGRWLSDIRLLIDTCARVRRKPQSDWTAWVPAFGSTLVRSIIYELVVGVKG